MTELATPETELFEDDTPNWLMDDDIYCLFDLDVDIIAIKDDVIGRNNAQVIYLFKGDDVYQVGITWRKLGDTSFIQSRDKDTVRAMVQPHTKQFGGEPVETMVGDSFVIYHVFDHKRMVYLSAGQVHQSYARGGQFRLIKLRTQSMR